MDTSSTSTWRPGGRHPGLELAGVADIDHSRAEQVRAAYGCHVYASTEELLSDPSVDIVANLTSIDSHHEVIKAALSAGKHVYSEKPLCPRFDQAQELVELAAEKGLALSCAPSNALSDSTQTLWKAVLDGAVGDVRLVYAEFDDNPVYLMSPEGWRSRTGAPWPYRQEYEHGCTHEHVGYHLTQLCSMFGPVESVTAFSKCTIPDKTSEPLDPPDTPDFSVACLNFKSGVVGRVTCSIAAPQDHQVRVIGTKGVLSVDTYRDYQCPVRYERFGKLSLFARKSRSVRGSTLLQRLLGVGGRPLRLVGDPPTSPGLFARLKQRELGEQDKAVGIAELADALESGRPFFPPPDLTLHLTELTLAIQDAGVSGGAHELETSFQPVSPRQKTLNSATGHDAQSAPGPVARLAAQVLDRRHRA